MRARSGGGGVIAVAAVLIVHASGARAQAALVQSAGEPTTPRSLGMADALAASAMSTTALFLNPAGVALGRVFHAEGWYGYTNDLSRHVAGVATTDSTTDVAGGLGFTYTYTGLEAEQNNQYDLRAALGVQLGELAALGLNLKYVRVDYAEGLETSPGNLNDFSMDAGAMITYDRFFVGVAGWNIINLDHPMAPLALQVGGGLMLGPARFEFDATMDWSTWDEEAELGVRYAAGGEILLADAYVLRAGYRYEDIPDVHGIAAGVGYVNPSVALDFGFQQDLSGARSDTRLGFSLRYFIQ
jgi:hypothetical protein